MRRSRRGMPRRDRHRRTLSPALRLPKELQVIRLRILVVLHEMKREGLSISAISRNTGLDRRTVRKFLERGLEAPAYGPRDPRPRLLGPYEDYLRERMRACPGLSGRRLLREIAVLGYAGGYTAVTDYMREIRATLPTPFERCFETVPGQQAQVDFASFTVAGGVFTDEPGVRRNLWLFSFVLANIRWLWGRSCSDQRLGTVLRCHVMAFEASGGAPDEVLYVSRVNLGGTRSS